MALISNNQSLVFATYVYPLFVCSHCDDKTGLNMRPICRSMVKILPLNIPINNNHAGYTLTKYPVPAGSSSS